MWDLHTIVAENNRVALEAMMDGQRLEVAQSPQPETWPLTALAEKLKIGPPLLTELIAGFVDIDTLQRFLNLIRAFLPEYEKEIMSEPRNKRVYRFCCLFAEKYFPLPIWANRINMQDFSKIMPLEIKGMSYDAYHNLEMRPGYLLLLSLVVYPYEGDMRDEEEREYREGIRPKTTPFMEEVWAHEVGDDIPEKGTTLMEIFNGAKVPLLDMVQRIVGEEVVLRIPEDGWTDKELHLLTDGTLYDGVGDFAAWVMSETGCVTLDTNYDDVEYVEGAGEPLFRWTQYNVALLAKEWPMAKQIREKIDRIVEWLEADPNTRFPELLEFLLAEAKQKIKERKKKGKREYDPTEHWCPLDQYDGESYEEDFNSEGIEITERPNITVTAGGEVREITAEQFVAGDWL